MKFLQKANLLAAFLLINSAHVAAQEKDVLLACVFPPAKEATKDAVIKKWLEDAYLVRLNFVLRLDPLSIIDGPGATTKGGPDMLWGTPRIEITERLITVDFNKMNAAPKDRGIQYQFQFNRFTGEATRIISALAAPNIGPLYAFAVQFGTCEITARKM